MSCYVVQNDVISRIAAYIDSLPIDNYYRMNVASAFGLDDAANEFVTDLAEKLFEMNCDAFNQRYEGRYKDECGEFDYTFPILPEDELGTTVHGNLRSYLYQCAEGAVTDSSPFLQLRDLRNWMTLKLVAKHKLRNIGRIGEESEYDFDTMPGYTYRA